MSKHYDLEFKKEVVREYLKGKSLGDLFATYGVSKSTMSGWIKNTAKNVITQNHKIKKMQYHQRNIERLTRSLWNFKRKMTS